MTLSHLHLVLNHVPVIGSVIAFGLLLLAVLRRSADLRRAALEIVVLVGLFSLPAYLSGAGGQNEIADKSAADLRAWLETKAHPSPLAGEGKIKASTE